MSSSSITMHDEPSTSSSFLAGSQSDCPALEALARSRGMSEANAGTFVKDDQVRRGRRQLEGLGDRLLGFDDKPFQPNRQTVVIPDRLRLGQGLPSANSFLVRQRSAGRPK